MSSVTEKRTQIYLTAEQHSAALAAARRRGISLAGVFREALDQYLASEPAEGGTSWGDDPVLALVGALEVGGEGPEDLDAAIDAAAYDEEA